MFNMNINAPLKAPGLAMEAGKKLAEAANALVYRIDGYLKATVAAGQNLAALTGITIATGYTKIVGLYVSDAATPVYSYEVSNAIANADSIDLASNIPDEKEGFCLLGWMVIKNATGSDFVGGTTDLDTANLTVTYIDNVNVSGK